MTREEHLTFCKRCLNQKFDMQQGIICGLTEKKADFEEQCDDFKFDEKTSLHVDNIEPIENEEVLTQLSSNQQSKFIAEQNFNLGISMSILVGFLGAILWGTATYLTGRQFGLIAIAIGALVGITMRYFGNGIENRFGITASIISIISCLLGNFFTLVAFVSELEEISLLETIASIDYWALPEIMASTFSVMDIVFYGIAAFEAYKFAFRKFTARDLYDLKSKTIDY